jgi:hypothetical protein
MDTPPSSSLKDVNNGSSPEDPPLVLYDSDDDSNEDIEDEGANLNGTRKEGFFKKNLMRGRSGVRVGYDAV